MFQNERTYIKMPKKLPKQLGAWQAVVAKVRKDNPGMSFKNILKKAKTIYRK